MLSYAIFFVSGFAALVYEISWSRQIGLLFGHTVQAAGIVLAAYFCGLAAGYLLGSMRWASQCRPLVAYGIAEFLVAGWALVIPSLLLFSESNLITTWLNHPSPLVQVMTRAVFAFFLLLPATTALGFTLPQMANRLMCAASEKTASRVSFAYALNTAGALMGVVSATFILLVHVGVQRSSFLAAGISAGCGVAAFLVHGLTIANRDTPEMFTNIPDAEQGSYKWSALAALCGFGTLALQILYTRVFSLVFHNSTYTFGTVVAVFLASLAIGAAVASRIQRRFNSQTIIGWSFAIGAATVIASLILFLNYSQLQYFAAGDSFAGYMAGALAFVTSVVGPPIVVLGVLLPVIWQAASANTVRGATVGRLTAVNSLAAAFGALTASFVLLPTVGLWQSFILLAGTFLIAAFCLLRVPMQRFLLILPMLTIVFGSFALLRIAHRYDRASLKSGESLVKRWNSSYGWIDLIRNERTDAYKVRQNLHYRFGETGTPAREYRQAHLPLVLHPNPANVLFLGMGTGLTAGAAIPHDDVQRIDVVELIPEVSQAAGLLTKQNFGLVDSSKVTTHVNDGRHFLLASGRKFDVVVSDLFVPWESETGYLYTVEHYEIVRDRLKPDGLFCQCLPLYQLGTREFELIADSLAAVFPHVTFWWLQLDSSRPVIALMGSETELTLVSDSIDRRLQSLWARIGTADPVMRDFDQLGDLYQGDWPRRPLASLNTDEHPRVEFFTPIANRDRKILSGARLRNYFDDVLDRLDANSARLTGGKDAPRDLDARRSVRKFLLLGR